MGGRGVVTLNPLFPTLYLAYREDRSSLHHMYCTALCVHSNLSKEHHFSAIVPCWRSKGDSVYRSHESLCTLWLHWSSNFRGVDTKLDTSCTNSKPRHSEEISLSYEMKCWHALKNWLLVFNNLKVFLPINFSFSLRAAELRATFESFFTAWKSNFI